MSQSRYFDVEARLWDSLGLDPTERYVHLPRLDSPMSVQQVGDGPVVLFVDAGHAPWIDDPERAAARIAGDVQVRR